MAKAIPSKEEISHEVLISLFTATLGVVLGIIINEWWTNHKACKLQTRTPSTYPSDIP